VPAPEIASQAAGVRHLIVKATSSGAMIETGHRYRLSGLLKSFFVLLPLKPMLRGGRCE
jgi:hypothetical protein